MPPSRLTTGTDALAALNDGEAVAVFLMHRPEHSLPLPDLPARLAVERLGSAIRQKRAVEDLRSSEARNRAMLEAVPDLIFRLSGDFHYLDFHIPDMPGVFPPPEHFVGRHITDALPTDLADLFMAAARRARDTKQLQTIEYQFPMEAGPRDRKARILPVPGSDEIMVTVQDVTERKVAERRLRALIQSKDDFIAAISHELRTPLTAVVGFSHLLVDGEASFSEPERQEMLDLIGEQASELAAIVDDLLAAARARMDGLQVDHRPLDLAEELAKVLESSPEIAAAVQVTAQPAIASGDPVRVRQILRNLLTNAVRYGGDDIWVEVDLRNGGASLRVCDNGPGIPIVDREGVFEAYQRSSRAADEPAALGLGLTVSRTLARLMNGDVTYNHHAAGSCFELTLPAGG